MMLLMGETWLNVDAMKALDLDTVNGKGVASIVWHGDADKLEDAEWERIELFDGQLEAIEKALRARSGYVWGYVWGDDEPK